MSRPKGKSSGENATFPILEQYLHYMQAVQEKSPLTIKEYKYDIIIMNDKSESCLNEISKDFIDFFISRKTDNIISEVGIITVTDNPNSKSYYRYEIVDWEKDSVIFDAKIEKLNYTIYKL